MKTYKQTAKRFEIRANKTDFQKVQIKQSKDSVDFIRQFYFDDIEIYESFFLLLLNRANNTIGYTKISQGGIAGTVVDMSIVAKYAIDTLASNVILCHNHPSGNLTPSQADKQLTEKVKQGLKLFDINVLDHVILTSDKYYSFADEGLL